MHAVVAVALREARRLRHLPVLWSLLLPIPAAMTVLLIGVFDSEVVRDLPVAVLDLDRSVTSRTAARWLDATRSARLAGYVEDLGAARSAVLEHEVYAVLVVPRHFERDLTRGRGPHLTLLYNEQYLTAGNNLSGEVARGAAAAAAGLAALRGLEPAPIRVDTRPLFNPAVSYAQGLGLVLIGGLLQVVIGLSTIYAVGRELADRTVPEWLAAADGSPAAAWVGKLGVYTVLLCLLVTTLVATFLAWYGISAHGPVWLLAAATAAFVIASQALGLLVIARTANLRVSLGMGSLLFGPAVAFSGVTFPLGAMPGFARTWAQAIPLTHAMDLARAGITIGDSATAGSPLAALALTTVVAAGLALPRLPRVLRDPAYWGRA